MKTHAQQIADDPNEVRAANMALLRRSMDAIGARDAGAVLACCHDDLLFQLPYESEVPDLDRAGFGGLLGVMFDGYQQFDIELTDVFELLDPATLIARYRSDCLGYDEVPYQNDYIGVFQFSAGLITMWREYDNPMVSAAAQQAHEVAAGAE